MERFLWIGFAGAIGTWTRWLVGIGAMKWFGTRLPWGTLIVNILGCFLIAIVMHAASMKAISSETTRLALVTGFLGGLTTYSSFNYETTALFRDNAPGSAVTNFLLTTVLCFASGVTGLIVARRIF